jgi:hypothetical protein
MLHYFSSKNEVPHDFFKQQLFFIRNKEVLDFLQEK